MTAALEGSEWSAACSGRTLPPAQDPVPILQEAGWASGPAWTGGKCRPYIYVIYTNVGLQCNSTYPDRHGPSEKHFFTVLVLNRGPW